MSLYEIQELFISAGNRIDSLWTFFLSVHLAIIGGLAGLGIFTEMSERIKSDSPRGIRMSFTNLELSLIACGYIAFSYINLRAKINAYNYLSSLVEESHKITSAGNYGAISEFYNQLYALGNLDQRPMMTWIIHVMTSLALVLVIHLRIKQSSKTATNE